MSILNKLTEGIVQRNVSREGQALLTKWDRTGLLEGISDDHARQSMACLLENQAKELLREQNAMSNSEVQGFAAVAFPIVRRVFGGLLANDLVSVQPMNLPSGLIFFLDFTRGDTRGADESGASVHGQGVVGSEITEGVDIGPGGDSEEHAFYNLSQGYSSARGACAITAETLAAAADAIDLSDVSEEEAMLLRFDQDLLSGDTTDEVAVVLDFTLTDSAACGATLGGGNEDGNGGLDLGGAVDLSGQLTRNNLMTIALDRSIGEHSLDTASGGEDVDTIRIVRRLTTDTRAADGSLTSLRFVVVGSSAQLGNIDCGDRTLATVDEGDTVDAALDITFAIGDNISEVSGGMGALAAEPTWEMESSLESPFSTDGMSIPEIDIKVDSVAITAQTRKLKAKWTPELGQDLNAYHNLDAEVELTSVLSEQIALEIDQEILHDLVSGSTAGTLHWSRNPGKFLDRSDGSALSSPPDFTGTVSEWYETLVETINDVSASIHRKTLRGGANFLVCGPEVANVLEFTSGFRASVTHDDDKGTVGAIKEGSINKKWDLYVDPYFPRNVILVGRKGSSFLESGYVYAPYVPLQTTPTIFGPEDFTPRKGVMTRYGKRMVRPDLYGLVVVRDLAAQTGAAAGE